MRFVNFPATAVPPAWIAKAARAADGASKKSTPAEIAAYIAASGAVWSALKVTLEGLSAGKCWYTEAKDKVSHWQVDHYRPKSLYPWLAFDWSNLRLCGGKPNLRKLNEFPLVTGSVRGDAAAGTGGSSPCSSIPQGGAMPSS